MGIIVVLLFYLVVFCLAAGFSAAVLATATYLYLKRQPAHRTRWAVAMAAFPFACVAYSGIWFVGYAAINDIVFHHDPGLGDGWYTDIGNGYAIDFIDVTDQGKVHPTRGADRGLSDPDGISGVRRIQVAGPRIFGSEDRNHFSHLGQESNAETSFFSIDTATHKITRFQTEEALRTYASQQGTSLALRPIYNVYSQFRFSWFEPIAGLALVIPPAVAFAWMIRRIYLIRREMPTGAAT